jgi:two-component system OmpR family response regulator
VLVDDAPEVRSLLRMRLRVAGDFDVVGEAGNGAEAVEVVGRERPDLVVLDVSMPGEDGLSIARRLRASGSTPIIMLTARDDVVDRIVGLEVGADDYLTKPFDLRELRARVRAVLRRRASVAAAGQPEAAPAHLIPFGKVHLDVDAHCLIDRGGGRHHLTATEFELLSAFADNPNRVLSRERLLDVNAGRRDDPFDRSVDIRVTRIRKKVESDPAKPQAIKTVRGAGYMYVPPCHQP